MEREREREKDGERKRENERVIEGRGKVGRLRIEIVRLEISR